ncbi:MAG: 2-dehydropantoate 2-reductase [Pseudomonadota bacterium]
MIHRWHILGAGAMGRLLACQLAAAGLDICLVTRAGPAATFSQALDDLSQRRQLTLARIGADNLRACDVAGLWVTTKANDALQAVLSVLPALAPDAPVILMHNGMGVREQLVANAPSLQPYSAITTAGAYLDQTYDGAEPLLVHAGRGITRVGGNRTDAPAWFSAVSREPTGMRWEADIDRALWDKLLINCAINPLTAIHRCRNGALGAEPALWKQVVALCGELTQVSIARGHVCNESDLLARTRQVIDATAANQSSMLRDVVEGRPTELDAITGFLLREARRLQVPCPLNSALYERLDGLQPSY